MMKSLPQGLQYFIKDILQILFLVGILAQPFRTLAHNGEINTLKRKYKLDENTRARHV